MVTSERASASWPDELPRIPGYDVQAKLGEGGMGVVYKARQLSHDRDVALKMIRGGRGAGRLELARFRIEAEAVACLSHPNIVLIYDIGSHAGHAFLALEFVPGASLATRIHGQPQSPPWAAELVRTLALALHHAHERSILHRDLKPANILLMDDGTPKVTDFGLAKFLCPIIDVHESCCTRHMRIEEIIVSDMLFSYHRRGQSEHSKDLLSETVLQALRLKLGVNDPAIVSRALAATQSFIAEAERQSHSPVPPNLSFLDNLTDDGTFMGSPRYMAPEQVEGRISSFGPPTDVYALGVMLYELLTGHPPFMGATRAQLAKQVLLQTPSPIRPEAPPELESICLRCLAKDPYRRYWSSAELANDLQQFLRTTGGANGDGL